MTMSRDSGPPVFFEDFTVGQKVTTQSRKLTEAEIIAFAKDFDPQPFHTDVDAAKQTVFGGLAASGWHTASVTMSLMVNSGLHIAGGMVGLGAEIAWPMATRPGDELKVEVEVLDVVPSQSKATTGLVTILSKTTNQNDETVQTLKACMIVPRRQTAT